MEKFNPNKDSKNLSEEQCVGTPKKVAKILNDGDREEVGHAVRLTLLTETTLVDVLRTYPKYANDIDELIAHPHFVKAFITSRKIIGDPDIEEVLIVARNFLKPIYEEYYKTFNKEFIYP